MKKLFLLLLLVSLVPFTVGCNGLFSSDSDGSNSYWPATPKASLISFKTTASLPAGTTQLSLRASVNSAAPILVVAGKTIKGILSGGVYVFATTFTTAELEAATGDTFADGSVNLPFTMSYTVGATRYSVPGTTVVSNTLPANSTSTTLNNDTTVIIAVVGGTMAVSYTPAATTTPIVVTQNGTPVVAFQVSNVNSEGKELTTTFETAAELTSLTPAFALTFTNAPTNLATANWTVKVYKLDAHGTTVSAYTLTKTDNESLFNVSDQHGISITVANSTTHTLSNGTAYKVELISTNLTAGSSTLEPVVVYFKTAGTATVSAVLTSLDVNGTPIAKAAFGTETTGVAVKSGTTTTTVIALTFDKAITTVPTAGSITLTRGTTTVATFALTDATVTVADGKLLVIFNQPLTATSSYTATLNSATWTGVDTTSATPVKFATN